MWYSIINWKGRQFERSTKVTDLKMARKVHRTYLDEIAVARTGIKELTTPAHERLQVSSILDDLETNYRTRGRKSLGTTLSHLVPLKEHFKGWRTMDIGFRSIEKYIAKRQKAEKSNATVNRELELPRRALNLAHGRGRLPSAPKVELLPESNTRTGFFERPELEALVAALPEYLRDFARFAYVTGMRLGEIKSLRWADS